MNPSDYSSVVAAQHVSSSFSGDNACDQLRTHLISMSPEPAGACAPGIPDCGDPSPILDIVCIHAAACDLAIADVGFRTTCMGENIDVLASLYERAREAHKVLPKIPGTEGLLALMDFQLDRLMAADIQVRRLSPVPSIS